MIAPKFDIEVLNCFLSVAYFRAVSVILLCESIQAAANLILPTFKAFTAILNPPPLSPRIFSTGTLVSLKKTCLVEDALMPNFSSSSPKVIPLFKSTGTIKAVIFSSSPILAKTIKRLANYLNNSTRTIHRNMCEELKREKELLNKQLWED